MKAVKNEYHLLFQWHCLNHFFSILCILVIIILQVVGFLCDGKACLKEHIPAWSAWIFHRNTNLSYCCTTIIVFGNSFNQWHCCYLCLLLLSLFMCYTHTHTRLKGTASVKSVSRASEGMSLQKQAALCSNMNLHLCGWWAHHNTLATEVPCCKGFSCVFMWRQFHCSMAVGIPVSRLLA